MAGLRFTLRETTSRRSVAVALAVVGRKSQPRDLDSYPFWRPAMKGIRLFT